MSGRKKPKHQVLEQKAHSKKNVGHKGVYYFILTIFILSFIAIPQAQAEFDLVSWLKVNVLGTSFSTLEMCETKCNQCENNGGSCSCSGSGTSYSMNCKMPSSSSSSTPTPTPTPISTPSSSSSSTPTCPTYKYGDGICHKSESIMSTDCVTYSRLNYDLTCSNTQTICTSGMAALGQCYLEAPSNVLSSSTTSTGSSSSSSSSSSITNPLTSITQTITAQEEEKIIVTVKLYAYGDNICHKTEPITSMDCITSKRLECDLGNCIESGYCTVAQQIAGMCGGTLTDNQILSQTAGEGTHEECTWHMAGLMPYKTCITVPDEFIDNPWVDEEFNIDANKDGFIDGETSSLIQTTQYYQEVIVPTLKNFSAADESCQVGGKLFLVSNTYTCFKLKWEYFKNSFFNFFSVGAWYIIIISIILGLIFVALMPNPKIKAIGILLLIIGLSFLIYKISQFSLIKTIF